MEHVPTVRELLSQGRTDLVVAVDWNADGEPTIFRLTTAGYEHLGAIMRRNAAEAVAAGAGEWVQPPSRTDLGKKPRRWAYAPRH